MAPSSQVVSTRAWLAGIRSDSHIFAPCRTTICKSDVALVSVPSAEPPPGCISCLIMLHRSARHCILAVGLARPPTYSGLILRTDVSFTLIIPLVELGLEDMLTSS